MPRLAPLALALLILLAGCQTDQFRPTPTPTTTVEKPPTYPPGLSANGIEDPYVLADSTRKQLENTSFTRTLHLKMVWANGSVLTNQTSVGTWEANRSFARFYVNIETAPWSFRDAPNGTIEVVANGTEVWLRQEYPNGSETVRRATGVDGTPIPAGEHWVTDTPESRWDVASRYARVDPGRLFVNRSGFYVRAENASEGPMAIGSLLVRNVSNVSFRAHYTPTGRLVFYDLELTGDIHGNPVTVRESMQVTGVGTASVAEPDWVGNATGPRSGG